VIVLDTNVISELLRPAPSDAVVRWVRAQAPEEMWTTVITLAELRFGALGLPRGRRRASLLADIDELLAQDFQGQVIDLDSDSARAYAEISAQRMSAGRTMSTHDAQIAGMCASRGAVLATRNVRDFEDTGIALHDPFA
jgi:predicted nucleic acid-binding protein